MSDTVLIVEDHPLYRGALVHMARTIFGDAGVVEATSVESGLRLAATQNDLRLILLDMGLPGLRGADAVLAFRSKFSEVSIIVISASDDRREAAAALRAGAKAFVSKACSTDVMTNVIQRVLAGVALESPWVGTSGEQVMGDESLLTLTPRQQEIIILLTQGHSNKEIGLRLGLAVITIKIHVSAIFRVLGVVNRTQAVLAARRMGLHTEPDNSPST